MTGTWCARSPRGRSAISDSRLTIVLLLAVALAIPGSILILTHIFGRVRGSRVELSPYECGITPFERIERHRFSMHFYLVAMVFILFDIEAAFLFPWAVTFIEFAEDKMFVLIEMVVFLGILVAGFAYLWLRGALEWE